MIDCNDDKAHEVSTRTVHASRVVPVVGFLLLVVAAFVGVDASEALIDRVCHQASFAFMKEIDHKFRASDLIPWASTAAPMMRQGNAAVSSELLTREQQQRIDRQFMADLRTLGSDFPYEEFCELSLDAVARAS